MSNTIKTKDDEVIVDLALDALWMNPYDDDPATRTEESSARACAFDLYLLDVIEYGGTPGWHGVEISVDVFVASAQRWADEEWMEYL